MMPATPILCAILATLQVPSGRPGGGFAGAGTTVYHYDAGGRVLAETDAAGVDLPPENEAPCDATSTLHDAWERAVHRAFTGILPELLGDRPKPGPSFASPDVRNGRRVRLRNYRRYLGSLGHTGDPDPGDPDPESVWTSKVTQST